MLGQHTYELRVTCGCCSRVGMLADTGTTYNSSITMQHLVAHNPDVRPQCTPRSGDQADPLPLSLWGSCNRSFVVRLTAAMRPSTRLTACRRARPSQAHVQHASL